MQLQIENSAVCQAKCLFCSYPTMQRAKGTMSLALSQKILDDAATIPLIEQITFTGLGEPLLDRHLVDRIRYARKVLPKGVIVDVYTNGNLLTPEKIDELEAVGLTTLYVSLNAVRGDQRLAIMGLDDFDRVVAACDYARTKTRMRTIVKGVASKDLFECSDGEAFRTRWGGWDNEGGSAFLHLEGSWAGTSQVWPLRILPTQACARALGQIMVLWDGRVSTCCFDGNGDQIFGDLNTQTLREVYSADPYVSFRLAHAEGRRAEIPICARCTGI